MDLERDFLVQIARNPTFWPFVPLINMPVDESRALAPPSNGQTNGFFGGGGGGGRIGTRNGKIERAKDKSRGAGTGNKGYPGGPAGIGALLSHSEIWILTRNPVPAPPTCRFPPIFTI